MNPASRFREVPCGRIIDTRTGQMIATVCTENLTTGEAGKVMSVIIDALHRVTAPQGEGGDLGQAPRMLCHPSEVAPPAGK